MIQKYMKSFGWLEDHSDLDFDAAFLEAEENRLIVNTKKKDWFAEDLFKAVGE